MVSTVILEEFISKQCTDITNAKFYPERGLASRGINKWFFTFKLRNPHQPSVIRVHLCLFVAKTFHQFLRRGGRRADLADDDAGGVIGEDGRFDRRRPAAMARVNVAMTVSPAPDTSNTSCATVGI